MRADLVTDPRAHQPKARETKARETKARQPKARRSTVKDVGALAGVSVATVSRALNGFDSVDPALKSRVLRAARELGYRPDGLARGLRRQVNTVLGMLIPDIENPFHTAMVRGAEDAAYGAGYLLMLCNTDEDVEKEKAYLDVLLGQNVAGLLLVAADEDLSDVRPLIEWGTPVVAVDRRGHQQLIDAVLVDNIAGSRKATEWLIKHDCTRIATIAGPDRTTTGLERLMGYRQALAAANIPLDENLVVHSDFHVEGGRRAAAQLLDQDPRPDAIFVANNQMAVGTVSAMVERGLTVPGDVTISCFDQLPNGLRWSDAIATIEQPAYAMGRTAVQLLVRRIAGLEAPPSEIRLQPELHEPRSEEATMSLPSSSPGARQSAAI